MKFQARLSYPALVFSGTKRGKQVFFKQGIDSEEYDINKHIPDVRTPVQFGRVKVSFYAIKQTEGYVMLSKFVSIRDWVGRLGYLGVSLVIPKSEAVPNDLHKLLDELMDVYWSQYIDGTSYQIHKNIKESYEPFRKLIEKPEYKLAPATSNQVSGNENVLVNYKSEQDLLRLFNNTSNPAMLEYAQMYIVADQQNGMTCNLKRIPIPKPTEQYEFNIDIIDAKTRIRIPSVRLTITQGNKEPQVKICPILPYKMTISTEDSLIIEAEKLEYESKRRDLDFNQLKQINGKHIRIELKKKEKRSSSEEPIRNPDNSPKNRLTQNSCIVKVTDESESPLEAKVKAGSIIGKKEAVVGSYRLESLPANFNLSVSLDGYESYNEQHEISDSPISIKLEKEKKETKEEEPKQTDTTSEENTNGDSEETPRRNPIKPKILGIIGAVLAGAITVGGFLYYYYQDEKKNDKPQTTEETTVDETKQVPVVLNQDSIELFEDINDYLETTYFEEENERHETLLRFSQRNKILIIKGLRERMVKLNKLCDTLSELQRNIKANNFGNLDGALSALKAYKKVDTATEEQKETIDIYIFVIDYIKKKNIKSSRDLKTSITTNVPNEGTYSRPKIIHFLKKHKWIE